MGCAIFNVLVNWITDWNQVLNEWLILAKKRGDLTFWMKQRNVQEAQRIEYLSLAPSFLCGSHYSIQENFLILLNFTWTDWQDAQFGTNGCFWSGLQIAAVAKIRSHLYGWSKSSNYSKNCTANTFSPLLSCGVQNAAKISWYATQLWVLCCTNWLKMWWGWDKKIHPTRFQRVINWVYLLPR